MLQNTCVKLDVITGIDIGKVGDVALSTGYRCIVTNDEDVHNLFKQLAQYGTTTLALEQHDDYSKNKRKSIRGLFIANDLIVRYARNRPFGYVNIILVDKFKSSIICSSCKFVDKKSRVTPWLFECTYCSFRINADVNAAKNIKYAAES